MPVYIAHKDQVQANSTFKRANANFLGFVLTLSVAYIPLTIAAGV